MLKTFADSVREATHQLLENDKSVIVIGEGVPDPKCVFGTTKGLKEAFPDRVFDMPVSENGGTGICIGVALNGLKPIMVHQRIDFCLYAMDQIVNNAAKWSSMFGGRGGNVPLVIRAIVGRGWGQGNQHSQNLSHLFATIPGLKVVVPSNAKDAKGLLVSATMDRNPVLFIEHRWLHGTTSQVPDDMYTIPIGTAKVLKPGNHMTVVAWSYMALEALKAASYLEETGVQVEVIDLRTIRPIDWDTIKQSLRKTKRLLVLEEAWKFNSLSSEIITTCIEDEYLDMVVRPARITLPDCYAPSTPALTKNYYPTTTKITSKILEMMRMKDSKIQLLKNRIESLEYKIAHDVPDPNFTGPF